MLKPHSSIWVLGSMVFIALAILSFRSLSLADKQWPPTLWESQGMLTPRIVQCGEDFGDLFLANLGQRDTFFINLSAGDVFRIQMRFQEEGSNELLELYGPDGSLLSSIQHSETGAAILNWAIDQQGGYTIVAAAADGNTIGFYGISFQTINQPSCATAIECGEEASSFLPLAGTEAYSLFANPGDSLRIQVQLVRPDAIPILQFFDSQGNLLLERQGSAGELLALSYDQIALPGQYMILVTAANGEEGGVFGFSVQRIEQACSISVSCGTEISDELATWAGMDAYHIFANGGEDLLIQLRFDLAPPLLYLYQPDGLLLDSLIGAPGELGILFYEDLPLAGDYLVIATSTGAVIPGTYGIAFQVIHQSGCSSPFLDNVCEDSALGQITGQAGMQAYTFEGEENEFVAFQVEGASANFNGQIRLYDSFGRLIQSSEDTNNPVQIVPFQLPMDGSYTLILSEVEGDNTGFFTLNGQRLGFVQPIDRTVGLCDGQSVFAGGAMQTEAGIYYDLSPQENDCDEVLVTEITRTEQVQINVIEAICFGDSLVVRGNVFKETGVYPVIIPSEEGCDTLITVDLLLLESVQSNINDTICAGQIYTLGRQGYFESGTYQDTLCDSIISLTLTVLPLIETQIDSTICDGQWVEINNVRYFETGRYESILETADGCDSLVTLNLSVDPLIETIIDTTVCTGQWIEVNRVRYFETGEYTTLLETGLGCDSLVTLHLQVQPPIEHVIDTSLCQGDWIEVKAVRYFESINDTILLETEEGCDSIVILNLIVSDTALTRLDIAICEGSSFSVGNATYTQTGEYVQVLEAANGCDSTVVVNLTVTNLVYNDIRTTLCQGAGFEINGNTFFSTGLYSDTITTPSGCDSIIRLDLTVRDTFFTAIDTAICQGEIVQFGDRFYSQPGTYFDTLLTIDQCDSIIRLQLDIIQQETNLRVEICEGERYTLGDEDFTIAGNYSATMTSHDGCDSMVNLELVVHPKPIISLQGEQELCSGESTLLQITDSYPQYQWSTGETTPSIEVASGDLYSLSVTDQNGCEGTAELRVQVSQLASDITAQAFPNGFNISCPEAADGQLEALAFNGIAPYNWNWSTGSNAKVLDTLAPGSYSVTVTDAFGCAANSDFNLQAPPAFSLRTTILPPLCLNEGGIVDVSAAGQTGPYTFRMDNTQQNVGLFEDISTGFYTISVTDANGCIQSVEIEVPQAEFLLEQNFDQAILTEGDSISLRLTSNFAIDKIVWEPARWLSCSDCPNPIATPEASTIYRAIVSSDNGCDLQAEFTIKVGPFDGFFIPNSFSPNGDGINDTYFFQSDHRVSNIQEVMIFDRWGKLLFAKHNLLPNNSQLGWDGLYQGRPVQVGVYTYFISIELNNGQIRTYKGDLTLLR